jgi:hypothetical protein
MSGIQQPDKAEYFWEDSKGVWLKGGGDRPPEKKSIRSDGGWRSASYVIKHGQNDRKIRPACQ